MLNNHNVMINERTTLIPDTYYNVCELNEEVFQHSGAKLSLHTPAGRLQLSAVIICSLSIDISYFSMQTYFAGTQKKHPQQGASNKYPQTCFLWRNKKNIMCISLSGVMNRHKKYFILPYSFMNVTMQYCSNYY